MDSGGVDSGTVGASGADPGGMSLTGMSAALWRERELLDLLLFKLEEEQLLLRADRPWWLPRAAHEVELVLSDIRVAELHRAVEAAAVAGELGLAAEAGLAELGAAAPDPWPAVLDDHRLALADLAAGVTAVAAANRERLAAGCAALDLRGQVVDLGVEQDAYRAALSVAPTGLTDTLVAFLR